MEADGWDSVCRESSLAVYMYHQCAKKSPFLSIQGRTLSYFSRYRSLKSSTLACSFREKKPPFNACQIPSAYKPHRKYRKNWDIRLVSYRSVGRSRGLLRHPFVQKLLSCNVISKSNRGMSCLG